MLGFIWNVLSLFGRPLLSTEVGPGIHVLTLRATNVVLIAEEALTLVDTGFPGSSPRIVELVERLGRSISELKTVVITHNHFDHVGALPELRELASFRVAAHRAGLAGPGREPAYPEGMRRLLRARFMSPVRRRFILSADDVDIVLEGGEVLPVLGGLEVVPTPGHTPDSISLFSARHRLLIVGDAVQKRRQMLRPPARMVSTDLAAAAESIRRMAGLGFDTLVTGHGQPFIGDGRQALLALLERLDAGRGR